MKPSRARKHGITSLTDEELVGHALEVTDARAGEVLALVGGLPRLLHTSVDDFERIEILFPTAIAFRATIEVVRRATRVKYESAVIEKPKDVYDLLAATLIGKLQEEFVVLSLDNRHQVIGIDTAAIGSARFPEPSTLGERDGALVPHHRRKRR